MHQILHGITLAFLRPVGACLGLLLEKDDGDNLPPQRGEAEYNLRFKNDDGCLLPSSGEEIDGDLLPISGEEEDRQDNINLADAENDLQPKIEGHREGYLPPRRGDVVPLQREGCKEEISAANSNLHALFKGPLSEEENAENEDLQPTEEGHEEEGKEGEEGNSQPANLDIGELQPANDKEDDEGVLRPTIGVGEIFHSMHVLNDDAYSLKMSVITCVHATIQQLPKACMVYADIVIVHARPRVDPKVKKKTSLLLCLTIHTPFHPGEYGHDGSPPYPHHEPYFFLCLYHESPYPSPHLFPQASSTSAITFQANLSIEGIFHFSHLRGRSGSKQVQEMKIAAAMMVKVFCAAIEANRRRSTTKMLRIELLLRAMFDPG